MCKFTKHAIAFIIAITLLAAPVTLGTAAAANPSQSSVESSPPVKAQSSPQPQTAVSDQPQTKSSPAPAAQHPPTVIDQLMLTIGIVLTAGSIIGLIVSVSLFSKKEYPKSDSTVDRDSEHHHPSDQ